MSLMAKWGPMKWNVNPHTVLAIQGLSFSFAQVADENTSTEEKKTTNERGTELMPLSFSTVLHSGAGVDVRAEVEKWEKLVTCAYPLYLDGKKLGPARLQLRKVSVSDVKLDNSGRMLLATLSFEFKEYDPATSSVIAKTTITVVEKAQKKTTNTAAKKATTKTVKVGSTVRIVGKKYATGQTIPTWVKQRTHKVSQIKNDKLLLGHPNGINSWVRKNDVTLV